MRRKEILNTSVVFNNAKNPWIKILNTNNEFTDIIKWVEGK